MSFMPEVSVESRRAWILQVLLATGAFAGTGQEHNHGYAQSPDNGVWHPAFLSAEQNRTLTSLAECVIPGSKAAACNRIIDLLLSVESRETQQRTIAALSAFEAEARRRNGRKFENLEPQNQVAMLEAASSSQSPLAPEFELIKEWVSDAYWSSQEGMQELGWKGRVAWSNFPGCPHTERSSQS